MRPPPARAPCPEPPCETAPGAQEGRDGWVLLGPREGPSPVTMLLSARAPCPWVRPRQPHSEGKARSREAVTLFRLQMWEFSTAQGGEGRDRVARGAGVVPAFTPVRASAGGGVGCLILHNFCASETFHDGRKGS